MEENLQSAINMMAGLPVAGSQVTVTCWCQSVTTLRYIHHLILQFLTSLEVKDIRSRVIPWGFKPLCCVWGRAGGMEVGSREGFGVDKFSLVFLICFNASLGISGMLST